MDGELGDICAAFSLESDFKRLSAELREDSSSYAIVEKALMAFRSRYFRSLNRATRHYQLSDYGAELREARD